MRSFYFWIITVISLGTVYAAEPITARDATIDNVQLHYLTAGHGPATVILLHGFAETSRMWRPIIPTLAEKFTVIAPDLPPGMLSATLTSSPKTGKDHSLRVLLTP